MSKYSDGLEDQLKNIQKVKEETKKILERGEKLGIEELHEAKSLERLKKEIMK